MSSEPEAFLPPPDEVEDDLAAPVLMDQVAPGYPPRQLARGLHTTRGMRRHLRAVRVLLNAMLFLALMYTITLTKALLIPLVLAAFLGLALNPLVAAGTR
ncbi:MAG TPA: AI-2E family transporter, partial [Rhodanobacter sp.]